MRFAFFVLVFVSVSAHAGEFGPGAGEPDTPSESYGATIRPTEPRSAEEEQSGFHLPPGFDIELVAAEPDIAKPLNMAFDAVGRLWISDTVEYPYPAAQGVEPRDSIKVISDTDGDDRLDTTTVFADKLNIPIGLLPYGDGVIAFSIPNLYYLRDTDGDGRCDTREVIIGPFDTSRDTHGMINSLRRGYDGWIYACHGFNNQSSVAGRDGWKVEMTSGNTFRFRPDGERVEHFTHGQVNPFGMTIDQWGNWFTADCHSKPITQLVRGGYYSSFGRPDDGLGFVPPMMEHLHGSTAISGLVLYDATNFPPEYRQQFYSGNVMTSRINRNALVQNGATFTASELPDFLTSDDPWFRPVDLQLAPDGSLYVADFYNRVIGHYEVPLDNPNRDRFRGRIWRISSKTSASSAAVHTRAKLAWLDMLVDAPEQNVRESMELLERPEALWLSFRHGTLDESAIARALDDDDRRTRVHAALIAAEMPQWSTIVRQAIQRRLQDDEPLAVRAAAEALGRHPDSTTIDLLLRRLKDVPPTDPILHQTIRIAVRDTLATPGLVGVDELAAYFGGDQEGDFLSILRGLTTPLAGRALSSFFSQMPQSESLDMSLVQHAIKTLPQVEIDSLVVMLQARVEGDLHASENLLNDLAKVADKSPAARQWAKAWTQQRLQSVIEPQLAEAHHVVAWHTESGLGRWPTQSRASSDGQSRQVHSSFPLGETYVGHATSEPFPCPPTLEFWIVGHEGSPTEPALKKSFVRLVDASSGVSLRSAAPPRSDTAAKVAWDLSDVEDTLVVVEAIDGDSRKAYAWIAFGDFSDSRLNVHSLARDIETWLNVVTAYQLTEMQTAIERLLALPERLDTSSRLNLLLVLAKLRGDREAIAVVQAIQLVPRPIELLPELQEQILDENRQAFDLTWLKQAASKLTRASQQRLAVSLAARRESLPWLVTAASEGWIASDLLRVKDVRSAIDSLADKSTREAAAALVAALPSEDTQRTELIATTLIDYQKGEVDLTAGAALFQKHCVACHQIAGVGGLVGPQLDGVGGRGAERLLQDILDPDMNVDAAFRSTALVLNNGTVVVGLVRNETPSTIEVIESTGKPLLVAVDEIEDRKSTMRSLMPSGIQELLGVDNVKHLIAFLVSKRGS